MFAIQPTGHGSADEKLTPVRIWACIGHGQYARLGVFHFEVFICEFLAVNGLAACPVEIREVTALAHEPGDYSVEYAVFEVQWFAGLADSFFAGTKCFEVLSCLRHYVVEQLESYAA